MTNSTSGMNGSPNQGPAGVAQELVNQMIAWASPILSQTSAKQGKARAALANVAIKWLHNVRQAEEELARLKVQSEKAFKAAEAAEKRAEVPARSGMIDRYFFTVSSPLSALRVKPGEAQGSRGTRVHVSYGAESSITTRPEDYRESWQEDLPKEENHSSEKPLLAKDWCGMGGGVLSGADFLLVRADGVLELDGRVTLRANDGTLIDATYWGLADLERDLVDENGDKVVFSEERTLAREPSSEAATSPAYLKFVSGQLKGTIGLNLSIRFETDTGPWTTSAEAQDATWTQPARKNQGQNAHKYRILVRGQFCGFGKMTLGSNSGGLTSPSNIQIDVYSLKATPRFEQQPAETQA